MLGKELGYDAHYYGPYSEEVASANTELKSLGIWVFCACVSGSLAFAAFEI
jgi:uncharacterized protein YwgA